MVSTNTASSVRGGSSVSEAYVISANRTPIGEFRRGLGGLSATELASGIIRSTLEPSSVSPADVSEVILGNVIQGGQGMNPARQAAVRGGLPYSVPAYTVNMVCASGLQAVLLADQAIRAGRASCILAGGFESMSNAPHVIQSLREGVPLGNAAVDDLLVKDGLWDSFYDCHMAETVERLVQKRRISRQAQDSYALNSHLKAAGARDEGRFDDEVVAVSNESAQLARDERPRADTSLEKLGRLRPAFRKDGTITAGNASGLNDGAALLMLSADKQGAGAPRAVIQDSATVAVDPVDMGVAPSLAIRRLLESSHLQIDDIDLWEVNEAFGGQVLAVLQDVDIPEDRLNVNGGSIALGHPIGCSGARILVTLLHEMWRREAELGVAALCVGGGLGMAVLVRLER